MRLSTKFNIGDQVFYMTGELLSSGIVGEILISIDKSKKLGILYDIDDQNIDSPNRHGEEVLHLSPQDCLAYLLEEFKDSH